MADLALVPRLDLWLAATMRADAALERWLARAGVQLDAARAVLADAERAGLGTTLIAGPERVATFFGRPAAARDDRLVYDLTLWPAHRFIWAVSRWGDVAPLGFCIREPVVIPPSAPRDVEWARTFFRPWYHTEHEVRCALGEPQHVTRFWRRAACWIYGSVKQGRRLRFSFEWGLLREMALEQSPPALDATLAVMAFGAVRRLRRSRR